MRSWRQARLWLAMVSPCGLARVLLPRAGRPRGASLVSPYLFASQTVLSHDAARRAGPMLLPPSLGYRGVSPTLRSTYHIKLLGMYRCHHVWVMVSVAAAMGRLHAPL